MLRAFAGLTAVFVMVSGCGGPGAGGSDVAPKTIAKYTQPLTESDSSLQAEPSEGSTKESDDSAGADSFASPWPQFRGPAMQAMSSLARVPIHWDRDSDFQWDSPVLDGVQCRGASSPVIVGDCLYLTAYSGCGTTQENRGSVSDLRHHVICRDKRSGRQIWQRTIQGSEANRKLSEHAYGHGFASSTSVVVGDRLFTFFGATGVFAFDLNGELLWQTNVGTGSQDFGSSASLLGVDGLLYVNASVEDETVYALDQATGRAVWKLDDVIQSWATPVLGVSGDGRRELIVSQQNWVLGLNPRTGEELWRCAGIDDYVVATPLVVDGVVYVTGGKQHQAMAIRLGGTGNVTASHQLWSIRKGSNISSLSHHDDVLYAISSNGVLQAIESKTGELLDRKRLGNSKEVLSSPTIAGDHMFIPTQHRGVVVMSLRDACELVAKNDLFPDEALKASISVDINCLYLRSDNRVYCIGRADESTGSMSSIAAMVEPDVIQPERCYSIDPKTNRLKTFLRCLVTEPQAIIEFMLVPYQSVITPEQTEKSTEYILANHAPFIDLRREYDDLRWRYLQGLIAESDYAAEVEQIEKLTLQHNREVRSFIKSLFSEAQMDQHLKEAGIVRRPRSKQ